MVDEKVTELGVKTGMRLKRYSRFSNYERKNAIVMCMHLSCDAYF